MGTKLISSSPSPAPPSPAPIPRGRGGEGLYVHVREVPRDLRRGANYRYYWRAFVDGVLTATGYGRTEDACYDRAHDAVRNLQRCEAENREQTLFSEQSISVSRESAADTTPAIPGNSGRNLLCPVSDDAPAATRSQGQLDGCLVAGEGGER